MSDGDDSSSADSDARMPFYGHDDNPRSRAALREFCWREARDGNRAGGPEFWRAYAALDGEFGPRGELEVPGDLLWELYERPADPRWDITYHLINFYPDDGSGGEGAPLAAVRDCYVMAQPAANVIVLFLSHALVTQHFRRTGLGALIRTLPALLGQQAAIRLGIPDADILLMAEMDPIDPATEATLIRMKAYGGSGFSFLPPQWLPYAQPDFSEWHGTGRSPVPVPLVLVTRWVGHEGATALPARLAWALYDSVDELHRPATPEDTAARREFAERTLAGRDPVPLIAVDPARPELLEPLLKSNVLPLLPRRLSGTEGEPAGDRAAEMRALRAWAGWGRPA